jgi:hypothetical protein
MTVVGYQPEVWWFRGSLRSHPNHRVATMAEVRAEREARLGRSWWVASARLEVSRLGRGRPRTSTTEGVTS